MNFAAKVRAWYEADLWTERMVRNALEKGKIDDYELAVILRDGAGVLAALGSKPTKAKLVGACEDLGIAVPEGATNAEISALIEAAS
jgi:hypothetical protein